LRIALGRSKLGKKEIGKKKAQHRPPRLRELEQFGLRLEASSPVHLPYVTGESLSVNGEALNKEGYFPNTEAASIANTP